MLAHGDALRAARQQKVGIEVVAQDRVIRARLRDPLLGFGVVGGKADRALRSRVGERGIDDVFDSRRLRRCDCIGMCREPRARLQIVGRDDEDKLAAREGGVKGRRIGEVAPAHLDALRLQIAELVEIAGHRDDRRRACREQEIDDLPAELAGGAGDDEGAVLHGVSS